MKRPSRFLRVLGAAGLLISLLAATITPVAAQDEGSDQDFLDYLIGVENAGFLTGNNSIYYPWVANDDDFGLGSADASISVQNLEDRDTIISIFVGNGEGEFDLVTSAYLAAYAAKTFHASALGIAEGSGAPVAVTSFNETEFTGFPLELGIPEEAVTDVPTGTVALVETPVILSNPVADDEDEDDENDGGNATQVVACVVNYYTAAQPLLGNPHGYVATVDHTFVGEDGDVVLLAGEWLAGPFTQQELQDTLNLANEGNEGELVNPFGGLNNDGDCFDVLDAEAETFDDSVAIGGVAKQAVDGETLPATTSADTAVSGYNAVNGVEIEYFDEWYLPIVQTNCGPGGCWDSMLRIANYDSLNNAVTVRFFPADDGSGSLQEGFQLQALVDGGDTWHINLGDHVPDEWVGSAHIYSDGAVFAMVDRYKVGYNMWITNTGSSADFENIAQVPGNTGDYVLFAPHVLLDYYGWNTGINVANLVNTDNNISIQYFNLLGNATQVLNQRLAAHGMTYFYDPSVGPQDGNQDVTSDPNAGIVGSALIWSDFPVAAAIDATKYPETDPNGGADLFQATSYSATANVFPWQAVPLVQKGSAIDGMGDTSGINIMNPNSVAATAEVHWVNPSGFQADNFGTGSVTIPAFANGFVYTLWQNNLPNGFLGAAQVIANVPVAAVSANVNYEVDGDGSAIYNAFNPCGLYRVGGACSFGDPFEPGGQSVTKYFIDEGFDLDDDEDDTPIAGVNFSITNTSGGGYQRDGVSGVDGAAIFSNVPVGTYDLEVNAVPPGYMLPEGIQETFVVEEGEDQVLYNFLDWNQGATKFVCLSGAAIVDDDDVDDPEVIGCEEALGGVDIAIYEVVGTDDDDDPVVGEVIFTGETGDDGSISTALPVGDYLLCMYDADDEATTSNGETVNPALSQDEDIFGEDNDNPVDDCVDAWEDFDEGELFSIVADESETFFNFVFLERGVINLFVGANGDGDDPGIIVLDQAGAEDMTPVAGVEICIESENAFYDEETDTSIPYEACDTSDEDGNLSFPDAPGFFADGVVEAAASLQGVTSAGDSELYIAEIVGDEYECVSVEGGELTAVIVFDCEEVNGQVPPLEPVSSLQGDLIEGDFEFDYSPTADVVQDGYSDDEGQDDGSYDIVVEVEGALAAIDTSATFDVDPLSGAIMTLFEGTCAEAGAELDSGVTGDDGLFSFTGLAPGDYCVEADPIVPTQEGVDEQDVSVEAGETGNADFFFSGPAG